MQLQLSAVITGSLLRAYFFLEGDEINTQNKSGGGGGQSRLSFSLLTWGAAELLLSCWFRLIRRSLVSGAKKKS
jgi:hypothetical protein